MAAYCSDHCDQLFVTATGIVKQPGSSNRITVRSSKYKRITFHLIITDVRPRDEGLYQCVIYNLQKIETTRTVRLKVKLAQQATLTTAEVRQTTVLLETATSDSLRNPPSLALAVPVTIACVGFIFLGPVLCLFLKYSRLKQRIHTQFDAHQVASNSHLYEEISPRFNAYIIQDISPGPEFDDGYETVGYEVLRRETQLLSDLYYTCHQV
ncbi:hypothetical protein MATL_G00050540 [Megalops atlanticus]|uniref:Immunoglobulin domain-containing protein n=1 Tax=Megalops atlanticus TaxID=7932 RepID=A0A9D3QFX9_MEGAT|nr:hypothetical protein MATL_G00050540 [Megalops atlanticus]